MENAKLVRLPVEKKNVQIQQTTNQQWTKNE